MAMAGVGVGLTAGPLVVQARFIKPDHIAISNAMLLFVSQSIVPLYLYLLPLVVCVGPRIRGHCRPRTVLHCHECQS